MIVRDIHRRVMNISTCMSLKRNPMQFKEMKLSKKGSNKIWEKNLSQL